VAWHPLDVISYLVGDKKADNRSEFRVGLTDFLKLEMNYLERIGLRHLHRAQINVAGAIQKWTV